MNIHYGDAATILIVFLFFSAFFGPVLFLSEILKEEKNIRSMAYAISQLMIGIWAFMICLYSTGIISSYQIISTALLPLGAYGASFQGMRFKWIIRGQAGSIMTPAASIPALLVFLWLLYPLLPGVPGYDVKHLGFIPICSADFLSLPLYYRIIHLCYPAINLYHIVLLSLPLISVSYIWKDNGSSGFIRAAIASDLSLVLMSCILFTGFLFSQNILITGLFFANIAYILTFINAQRYPNFNEKLHFEIRKARYEHSKISGIDVNMTIERMSDLMTFEKIYADEDMSLKRLALELEITSQQLSQILNERLNKNFNRYINEFRVEEAKRMLRDEPKRSITSIAFAVGFNSSSAFSMVFSRYTGHSPREYRIKNTDNVKPCSSE